VARPRGSGHYSVTRAPAPADVLSAGSPLYRRRDRSLYDREFKSINFMCADGHCTPIGLSRIPIESQFSVEFSV
jgi:hypothetical protein